MSRHSYATWATFDVEKELQRVDDVAERETQQKQQQHQIQAKKNIETVATHAVQQAADVLAAQAAVAALKAKKKKTTTKKKDEVVEVEVEAADAEKIATLQTRAKFYAEKHELLQLIMAKRRLGDTSVSRQKWQEAYTLYQAALVATKKLHALAPVLLQLEAEQEKLADKSLQAVGQHSSCRQDVQHECTTFEEMLPPAHDLVAIIDMLYKDIYMGIGTCEFKAGRVAAATEAFKQVLQRDETHSMAWRKRGEAFEKMDAYLLALLHYNQLTNVVRLCWFCMCRLFFLC